ncbi:MAG: diaminopimelate epimerase [Paracoccaceae bacterium]
MQGISRQMGAKDTPLAISFMKMHGIGNDFVVIDSRHRQPVTTPNLACAVGDRHFGVGFDQLVELRTSDHADFALDFWNSDGSTVGACGNATRCVAEHVLKELGKTTLTIETERGILAATRRADGFVSVNMGQPQFEWRDLPLAQEVDLMHLPLSGDPVAVGMGNPHCVFFVPDAQNVDLAARGPVLEHDPLFPKRVNVEFVSVLAADHLRMRVWERGVGVTLACGSGACAVGVAAHLRGLTGRHVLMDLDGGRLEVDWRDNGVWLTGPTANVFAAVLSAEFVAAHS